MTSPSPVPATSHRVIRGDVEGLRAVAVGTVLLYHLHVPWFPGGFAGVDVFFVISGFLITSLLLREVARTGSVSLAAFYARRARRLLPAASVVLAFTLVAGWLVLPADDRPHLVDDVLGSTLYVVNWVLAARSVDYLAEDADISPLQHYWSLSVEEQFYVLWPLLILLALFLARRYQLRGRRLALVLLSGVGALSLLWSVVQTRSDPATAYFVTTTRLWELAAGAVLAFAVPRLKALPRAVSEALVLLGLALILLAVTRFDAGTPWPGTAALVPVVGSAMVIAAGVAPHPTIGGRLLGLRPMVLVGGLSYAIYLWHWPLIVLAQARWGELGVPALVALGGISVLAAWLTKRLVEDPIRFRRPARPARSLVAGGATMALICAAALAGWTTLPRLPVTTTTPGPAALVADPGAADWELRSDPTVSYTASGELDPDPMLAVEDVPSYYADQCQVEFDDPDVAEDCVYGDVDSSTEVVLWGDSKLGQYFSAFEAIATEEGWRLQTYLKSRCPATVDGSGESSCNQFGRTVLERLLQTPPDAVVISSGAGATSELVPGALEAVEALREAKIPVVVLMDNAAPAIQERPEYDTAFECAQANVDDLRVCDFFPPAPAGEELLRELAERADLPVIDLGRWICPPGAPCPVAIGGQLVYRQGSHVTDTYARSLTPFLHRELIEVGLGDTPVSAVSLDDVPNRSDAG